jgi:thiamine biosynthesis protein ThiC
MVNGGLTVEKIINKLISFGSDGVVFISIHNGVTTQITKKAAPFMLVVHWLHIRQT